MNRTVFFDRVRATPFAARLTPAQVDGLSAILDAAAKHGMALRQHLAYALATAFHETGAKMVPVTESLTYTSAARIRAVWPSRFPTLASAEPFVRNPQGLANRVYGGRMGNTGPDDGWRYRGRGLAQITGRANYARAARELGRDLAGAPDLALQPAIAAEILIRGMMEGWFTGITLADCLRPGRVDYRDARRIINGTESAGKIIPYAEAFDAALKAAGWVPATAQAGDRPVTPVLEPPDPAPPPSAAPAPIPVETLPPPAAKPAVSFWAGLLSALARILAKKG